MNTDEFKEKYEELKNNPMYQKYCSVLETKDKIIKKIKSQLEQLEQENEKLKADYGTKVQVERDLLKEENQSLKRQLNYLRSGEYYNQLRFERDMLQDLVDNGEVSKEDKEFIDMIHRNTELLEENQKLKDRDVIIAAELTKLQDENIRLKKESQKQKEVIDRLNFIKNRKNQDKLFIDSLLCEIEYLKIEPMKEESGE